MHQVNEEITYLFLFDGRYFISGSTPCRGILIPLLIKWTFKPNLQNSAWFSPLVPFTKQRWSEFIVGIIQAK